MAGKSPRSISATDREVIDIDASSVERYVFQLGAIGAYGGTGVWRVAYSPEWVRATDIYARWAEEAGLSVAHDAVGNVWAKLHGSSKGRSVVSGSHIDTQKPGGRYDGALGALAALITIKGLKERFGKPKRTLEAVALCEEEASRFAFAHFWGSRAITGRIMRGDPDSIIGTEGESIADAMRSIGLDPARIPEARRNDIDVFIELHIEQGPALEAAGLPVGIVNAITGIRQVEVTLDGEQNHAGAFPMDLRRDPMAGFAEIASGLIDTAHRWGRPAVTTIGRCIPDPNAPAVIPSTVKFTVDARHPDPELRAQLYAVQDAHMREVAARRGLRLSTRVLIDHEACPCDAELIKLLADTASLQTLGVMTMPSGAAHDAQQMASIAKVAMIFVRSRGGRSHTPEEFSSGEDMVASIQLLAGALHTLAY